MYLFYHGQTTKVILNFLAHKGMLFAASNIYNILMNPTNPTEGVLSKFIDDEEYNDYDFIVTGHSLGAGTAAILGFFLRSEENIKDRVKVYAYGIPGGLLNAPAREESKEFIVSVIHNDDVISRLSIDSMFGLRSDIRNVLCDCNQPKYKIVSAPFLLALGKKVINAMIVIVA